MDAMAIPFSEIVFYWRYAGVTDALELRARTDLVRALDIAWLRHRAEQRAKE